MKLSITLEEAKELIRGACITGRMTQYPGKVRFIHKYSDGSGESDVENVAEIDRVEIDINGA